MKSKFASKSSKICLKCGANFLPNSAPQKYCKKCSAFKCQFCGRIFTTYDVYRNPKYCSWVCYRKAKWARDAKKEAGKIVLTEEERGWLAGLIDGEGSIIIFKRKPRKEKEAPYHDVGLSICGCSRKLIEKIRETIGVGSIVKTKTSTGKPFFIWQVKSRSAIQLIREAYPLLIAKKSQAELVLKFSELDRAFLSRRGQWGNNKLKGKFVIPDEVLIKREELYQAIRKI